MVTAGATANTTEGNSRASRESGTLCSHSHGESIDTLGLQSEWEAAVSEAQSGVEGGSDEDGLEGGLEGGLEVEGGLEGGVEGGVEGGGDEGGVESGVEGGVEGGLAGGVTLTHHEVSTDPFQEIVENKRPLCQLSSKRG